MPVTEHQRPIRNRKQTVRFGLEEQINVAEEVIASALCAAEMEEPKTMSQAKKRPDAVKWMKAAKEEMDSLLEHDTWSLTKPPLGRKVIGSKWVFKIKHDDKAMLRGTSVDWLRRDTRKPKGLTTTRRSHR